MPLGINICVQFVKYFTAEDGYSIFFGGVEEAG